MSRFSISFSLYSSVSRGFTKRLLCLSRWDSPLALFRRNIRMRFRALDDDGLSRTRTYTFAGARARARTLNGERRESARTVADAPRTLDDVLGIARSDRGRRSAAPTTKRSFLRRHRSSLSRSATVVHVRPCSAGKCVYAVKERERES